MIKMVCFDMDGSIADLYSVKNWLEMLRTFDPTPYLKARPMWNMTELAAILQQLQEIGIEIRIITWLSKESNPEYDAAVRLAKKEWLAAMGFPYDHFHGVAYGATKADSVRRYLNEDEEALLIDDNAAVRKGWHMGDTIDPTSENIIEVLKGLLAATLQEVK